MSRRIRSLATGGPAAAHAIPLGNNAAGLPHAFLGASRPLDLWLVRFHGRVEWRPGDESDNQLASVFGRWVFPKSGVEFYGEYGKEDYNWDVYDLAAEPDQDAAYTLGMQKVWRRDSSRFFVLLGEVLNSRESHLAAVRSQTPFYVHVPLTQGHTERGQVLGSAGAHGGGAAELWLDEYTERGRWSAGWSRTMQSAPRLAGQGTLPVAGNAEVMHALTIERVWFRRDVDVSAKVSQVLDVNRQPGSSRFNTRVTVSGRAHW